MAGDTAKKSGRCTLHSNFCGTVLNVRNLDIFIHISHLSGTSRRACKCGRATHVKVSTCELPSGVSKLSVGCVAGTVARSLRVYLKTPSSWHWKVSCAS